MRVRSPNYPALGLAECVEAAAAAWPQMQRAWHERDATVGALGYGSYHGASATMLSALVKYRLLEKESGSYRLTELAGAIVFPEDDVERRRALEEAARAPEMFARLLDELGKAAPSPDATAKKLSRMGFSQTAVRRATAAFHDTVKLLRGERDLDLDRAEPPATRASGGATSGSRATASASPGAEAPGRAPAISAGEKEVLRGLLGPNTSFRVLISGRFGPEELRRLVRFLLVQEEFFSSPHRSEQHDE